METQRLVLRRFEINDAAALYTNWASSADTVTFMRMPPHQSADDTRAFVQSIIDNYEKTDTYRWAIVLKENNEPIGFIGLTVLSEYDETGDFGYSVGKAYWNYGYTTEALAAVLRYGLEKAGFNRLEAYHSIRNMASGRVMQKCGLTYEGRARQKYRSNLGFEDSDMYAIIKEDIEKVPKT